MPDLVLASTSPYRRALLTRLGVRFTPVAPPCDEEALKDLTLAPAALALKLAHAKAASVVPAHPTAYVLGSDQLVALDAQLLGKPGTLDDAVAQLRQLRGRSHRLITAFVVLHPDGSHDEHVDVHTLHMRALSDVELARYAARDRPLDCAGSYKIESGGIALFERIEGADFTAIMGLPLIALTNSLRACGFELP